MGPKSTTPTRHPSPPGSTGTTTCTAWKTVNSSAPAKPHFATSSWSFSWEVKTPVRQPQTATATQMAKPMRDAA